MEKTLRITCLMIDKLVEDVKEFVKNKGGFINTQNPKGECDNIYAYILDWDFEEVYEKRVIAIRVNEFDDLLLLCEDKGLDFSEPIDFNDYEDSNKWYIVGSCGDSLFTAQTILSVAESIGQY